MITLCTQYTFTNFPIGILIANMKQIQQQNVKVGYLFNIFIPNIFQTQLL